MQLAIEVVLLLLLARVIEPMYGSKEFLKFIFLVDVVTCSAVFACVYVAFALSQSGTLLYSQFSGFHGIIAGLLVGVKQIMPGTCHQARSVLPHSIDVPWICLYNARMHGLTNAALRNLRGPSARLLLCHATQ